MINLQSLRFKLFAWYFGSLVFVTVYFYLAIHLLSLPHSTHTLLIILALMTIAGFFVVYMITSSITRFSSQVKTISSKNLGKKIRGFHQKDEIGELAESFNNLLDRLHEAFKREQQFIGDMAHEMKTPLATLHTSLEVALSKDRTKEEYKKLLYEAMQDTDRLSATLKNVLDLAWAEAPHDASQTERFSLSELIDEIVDIAEKLAQKKSITVKSDIEKNIEISGFKEKLAHALLNIIENSVHYTEKGVVEISLGKSHGSAVITVRDTGPGIPAEEIPHIFERFYRGKNIRKKSGSGLGLAIAQSIIKLHKGKIEVESKIDTESKFIITLPLQTS